MAGFTDQFRQAETAARHDFTQRSLRNTFAHTQAQQRGSRQLGDFQRGFNRSLPSFTTNYTRRGLTGGGISSGVYQNAMRQYVGDYTRDYGRMQQDYDSMNNQFGLNQAGFQSDLDAALASIAAQKAAAIANTAQHINALRPYMGV